MAENLINNKSKSRISVCFVSLDIYPLFNPQSIGVQGGSEVDLYMLAKELVKDNDFQVSIVTGDFGQPNIEVIDNVTIYKAKDIYSHPISGIAALWGAMRLANADIYFKKGASITTDIVALFCRVYKKNFFLRTGTDCECDGSYFLEHPFKAKTYLWSIRQAGHVFVQKTSDVPRFLKTTGINAIAISNGHNIKDLKPYEQQKDSILWVGRTDDLKQPHIFIELAAKFPSEKFIMICQKAKGDRHYNELVHLASNVDNLKFIESVLFNKIHPYFQKAKVLVNTSRAEGFPNTFIQAGIFSTAILSLKVNPDGFLDKFNCGLCAAGNRNKFTDLLESLLSGDSYIELGKNARKYVEENHDISKIIQEYKKYFIDFIKELG